MKVLVFTTLFPNNIWSDHGIFVKERMTRFARLAGCQVKVVAPVPYFPPLKIGHRWRFSQVHKHEVVDGIDVFHPRYFMIPKIGMVFHGLFMFLSIFLYVKKVQRTYDFDVIDAHYVYPDGFAAVLLGKWLKKPVAVSARGTDINLFTKFPLILRLINYTLRRSHKIIAVCQALKDAMIELGIPEEKISVVPNGVDIAKFYAIPKQDARKELGIPPEKTVILSVGSLIPRKGFDLLISALEILISERRETNLYAVIIGEGSFRQELEIMISAKNLSEYVKLVDKVPHRKLYVWYNAADLFCLLSSREGWPNVVMEALACETPVMATEVWGIPEIITCDDLGLLTKRDEQEIAKNISAALRRTWQSDKIRRYIRKNTWDKTAISVLDVLQSILKSKNAK